MKNFDHYAETKRLAVILRQEGLNDWAKRIVDSMSEGATGTEIFMILRLRISEFLSANLGSQEAVSCAQTLYRELDASLG